MQKSTGYSILIIEGLTCHKKPLSFAAKYIITTHYQTLSEVISPGLLVCKIRLTITRLIIHGLISLVPAYQSFRWSGTDTDLNLAALLSQITLSLVQISILWRIVSLTRVQSSTCYKFIGLLSVCNNTVVWGYYIYICLDCLPSTTNISYLSGEA